MPLAALPPVAESSVPMEYKAKWAPEPAWMFHRREKSLVPARNKTLNHPACSTVTILTTFSCLLYATYVINNSITLFLHITFLGA